MPLIQPHRWLARDRSVLRHGLRATLACAIFALAIVGCGGGEEPLDRETAQANANSGANVDIDELRATPVAHRFVHGRLGDAKFQIALPQNWNGKFIMGTRGFSGDENSSGAFKTAGLTKGYAYALSDEGWSREDIVTNPEDKYYESRRRIIQLTHYAKQVIHRHYGVAASRTYMAGGSNGGHHTKWMVEDYPALYDGGLAGYGYNSALEEFRGMPVFLRNFDVIRTRIADIAAARAANPNWDQSVNALTPPLTAEQVQALNNIYDNPAVVSGLTYNTGRSRGSESTWLGNYNTILNYLVDSLGKFDPHYDPNGDGLISVDEILAWDPYLSKVSTQHELRKLDLTGNLKRPIIVAHGTWDVLVPPGEADGYKRLVERQLGVAGANDVHALYYIPRMGHGGAPFNTFVPLALDALDKWVDYRESGGAAGQAAPSVLGGYPRE